MYPLLLLSSLFPSLFTFFLFLSPSSSSSSSSFFDLNYLSMRSSRARSMAPWQTRRGHASEDSRRTNSNRYPSLSLSPSSSLYQPIRSLSFLTPHFYVLLIFFSPFDYILFSAKDFVAKTGYALPLVVDSMENEFMWKYL